MSPNSVCDTPVPELVAIEEVVKEEEMPSMTEAESKSMETVYVKPDSLECKINYFNELGCVLGNVQLEFKDGKKQVGKTSLWKNLTKSEHIKGQNFLIRAGKVSGITVFDVDIKQNCNGQDNLMEVGIDFDDYVNDCIKVRTQSGGFHYIFKYDPRFTTGANCYGVKGFDIRNDAGIVFAGDRYEIVSKPEVLGAVSNEVFEVLNSEVKVPKIETKTEENCCEATISDKYYDLIKLLPKSWFNDFDKWTKPGYALYNCDEIANEIAYATWLKLLSDHSKNFDEKEALRIWNKIGEDTENKFTFGTIKKIIGSYDNNGYNAWKDKYPYIKPKTVKDQVKDEEERMIALKREALEELTSEMESIERSVIRDKNGIEVNDLLMANDRVFSVSEMALLIRQTVIRVENNGEPAYYVKEIFENKYKRTRVFSNKFVPRDLMQTYKNMALYFKISFRNEILPFNFCEIIASVKHQINHRKVVMEPHGAFDKDTTYQRKTFNLFPGLLHSYDPNFVADEDIVFVWLNHLKKVVCSDSELVFDYLKKYFKHILVNPMEKTGTVIIIKGKQGSGKNSPFDIFNRFVLGPNLSITTPRMDLITGRFNSIRQSMLMCVLDEAVDNSDRSLMNKFKNLITADEFQLEYKGKEPVTLDDFANFIVISNNDFASFIEESDRRALCLETNDEMIGNRKYFNKYWSTLSNKEAGKHIFHWLLNNVDIEENWHPQDTPSTAYKQELKQYQANTAVKYVLHLNEQLTEWGDFEIKEICPIDMFNRFASWCETYKHRCMSKAAFDKIVKPYFIEKRTDNVRHRTYSIDIFKETLKLYFV